MRFEFLGQEIVDLSPKPYTKVQGRAGVGAWTPTVLLPWM